MHSRGRPFTPVLRCGGGRAGTPVHGVSEPEHVTKLRGHYCSVEEASGRASCLIQDSADGCGFPCRRVPSVPKDASNCGR